MSLGYLKKIRVDAIIIAFGATAAPTMATAATLIASLGKWGGNTRVEASSGTASDSYSSPAVEMSAAASDNGSLSASIEAKATGTPFHHSSAVAKLRFNIEGGDNDVPLTFNFNLTGSLNATKNFGSAFSYSTARVTWSIQQTGAAFQRGVSGIACYTLCLPYGDNAIDAYASVSAKIVGEFGEFDLEDIFDSSTPVVDDFLDNFEIGYVADLQIYEEKTSILEANTIGFISSLLPSIGIDDVAEVSIAFEPTFILDRTVQTNTTSSRRSGDLTIQLVF